MKHNLRIISCSIIALIFIGLIGVIMFLEIPRIKYTYDEKNDAYTIARVYGDSKRYTIPSNYKGKRIYRIGRKAFQNHSNLEGLDFEGEINIEYIDPLAFYNCDSLVDIVIPESVEFIGNNAFLNCSSLKSVRFNASSSLKKLAGAVFYDCQDLELVSLPKSLLEIGTNCFLNTNISRLEIYRSTSILVDALAGVDMDNVVILDN